MQPQSRVLHIDITGHDRAGVTHSLTTILARSGARILDVGQAVIHDALALGLLVELTEEMSEPLLSQCHASVSGSVRTFRLASIQRDTVP